MTPHLTELSKGFQAGCFNFAQIKASVELCINKLCHAAAESELKVNCEKFDTELGELGVAAASLLIASRGGASTQKFEKRALTMFRLAGT